MKEKLEVEAAAKVAQAILGDYRFDGNYSNIVDNLFHCLKTNPEDTYLLFGANTSPDASNYGLDWLRAYLEQQSLPHWIKNSTVTEPEARIIFDYTVSSIFYLLKIWVAGEPEIDEARFKELYLNLINHGVYHYIYK